MADNRRENPSRNKKTLLIKNSTKSGYMEAHAGDGVNLAYPDSKTRRWRVLRGISPTLMCSDIIGVLILQNELLTIRKLTPREYFRLQGWTDDYYEKARFVNGERQLYKQAGNAVTVSVAEAVGRKLK